MAQAAEQEEVLGKAYDLRLIQRLWKFIIPYKRLFLLHHAAVAAAASLRRGPALLNEDWYRPIHRRQGSLGFAECHAAVPRRPDRRDRGGVRAPVFLHAGGAALFGRHAGGGFCPCAETADELLRPQSGGPIGDAHDDRCRRAPGNVFLRRADPALRFYHGGVDRQHHVLSECRLGAWCPWR